MIKDIHDNNIEAWFQDIVEVTRPSNIEGLIGNVNEINLRDSKAQSQQQMEAHRESLKREVSLTIFSQKKFIMTVAARLQEDKSNFYERFLNFKA